MLKALLDLVKRWRARRAAEKAVDLKYDPLAMDECIWIPISPKVHGPFVPGSFERPGWPKNDTCQRCGYVLGSEEYGHDLPSCLASPLVSPLDVRYDPLAIDDEGWVPVRSRKCLRCWKWVGANDVSDCLEGAEVPGGGLEPHVFRA